MKKMIMYGMVLALAMCCFAACGSVSSDSVSESSSTERRIIGVTDPGGIVARVVEAGDGSCKAEVIWKDEIFAEGDIVEVNYDTIYYVESYEDNANDYPEEEAISVGDVIEVTYFDYDLETMQINVTYIEHWSEQMLEDTEPENTESENQASDESEIRENSETENQTSTEETEQEAAGDEGGESADDESISMKFVEFQEEASGLTAIFSIENSSDNVIYYGAEFTLEKSVDDAWESCEMMENADWNALLYELQSGETDDITVYLETYYGELSEGRYRITKTIYFNEDLNDDNATDISCIFDIS